MDNLEYLKKMKKDSYREHQEHTAWENRQVLALEIIAEELCIMNNPKYEVTMVKPKIKIHKKSLNEYMKKTSATKIK